MCRGGRRVHHILTLRNGCCLQLSKQYSFRVSPSHSVCFYSKQQGTNGGADAAKIKLKSSVLERLLRASSSGH